MNKTDIVAINKKAWEADAYTAWVTAYGTPEKQARTLKSNPEKKLRKILPHLESVNGKIIANPLGSHGRVAVSLALLGAEVTVFDISEPNATYGLELAKAANTSITYVTSDFIKSSQLNKYQEHFDLIVSELGILHYFLDLDEFVQANARLLKPDGQLILNDFHPISKKCFSDQSKLITGNYFDDLPKTVPVAYADFLPNSESLPSCLVRYWTLADIITSFAQNGFIIKKLQEFPNKQATGIPIQFTLVAMPKINSQIINCNFFQSCKHCISNTFPNCCSSMTTIFFIARFSITTTCTFFRYNNAIVAERC